MNEGDIHSLGSGFNSFVDGLNEASWRLLELPLFVLLLALMLAFAALWLGVRRANARFRPGRDLHGFVRWCWLGFFVLAAGLVVDHKIVATLSEIRALHSQSLLANQTAPPVDSADGARFYDEALAARVLGAAFGEFEVARELLHPGVEYVVLRTVDPDRADLVVHAFLAIVDLTRGDLAVEVTPTLGEKSLTSDFGRCSASIVAINGEAGASPMPGSGFGAWTGPWIAHGESVAFGEDSARPFIGFARDGLARYYAQDGPERRPAPDIWSAIWGRWDILRAGVNLGLEPTSRKPRTIMAIDRTGERLLLLVIAGGRPGFSLGTSLKAAASIAQAFGAWNAMACDEGGSSAMYLAKADRIVNQLVPGSERVVYTHFGIAPQ